MVQFLDIWSMTLTTFENQNYIVRYSDPLFIWFQLDLQQRESFHVEIDFFGKSFITDIVQVKPTVFSGASAYNFFFRNLD
jgi:hypothetical protein